MILEISTTEASYMIPILLQVALGQRDHSCVNGKDYPTADEVCTRDYAHVSGIADAHLVALNELHRACGQIFIMGKSRGFSVLKVVGAVRRATGWPIEVVYADRRRGDPAPLIATSEEIRSMPGLDLKLSTWTPWFGPRGDGNRCFPLGTTRPGSSDRWSNVPSVWPFSWLTLSPR